MTVLTAFLAPSVFHMVLSPWFSFKVLTNYTDINCLRMNKKRDRPTKWRDLTHSHAQLRKRQCDRWYSWRRGWATDGICVASTSHPLLRGSLDLISGSARHAISFLWLLTHARGGKRALWRGRQWYSYQTWRLLHHSFVRHSSWSDMSLYVI